MKLKTINGMRECFTCKEVKPISEFYHRRISNKTISPYSDCKECQKKRGRERSITHKKQISDIKKRYREKHKEELIIKHREHYYNNKELYAKRARNARLKRNFGITEEEYQQMLSIQNNKCAICGCDSSNERYGLVVDHDHNTGKIRELLCNSCNTSIGGLKEDIKILENAILYLTKHNNK